ncbi:MAG: type II toxin-antitoxin system Phd/YefM family antitoxin [Deltaproteobacteria bacterium]|nr:type II toxin-antitoxin system Phd/YefM family antitoxin [Deltaproteobacteria bacterium]
MERTNALKMRQNLGKVLKRLRLIGKPILVEQNRKPVAALISLEDYQKRFVDIEADQKREALVQEIKRAKLQLPSGKSSLDLIRELRGS